MIRCKVFEVGKGFMFYYECERLPEKDTAMISQDGRYMQIVSVRHKLKYCKETDSYRSNGVDIIVSDYGSLEDEEDMK